MQLHRPSLSPKPLWKIIFASVQTKILLTGIKLQLFEKLDQSAKSADEIAQEISGNAVNTALLLNGLTALGLLEKIEGRYINTLLSRTFLLKSSISYMGEVLMMQATDTNSGRHDLQHLILKGPDKKAMDQGDSPEIWGKMAKNMANMQRSGAALRASEIVSRLPEFPAMTKMLDLGGGPGINCIAMVDRHPSLKAVIFDRKPSTDVSEEFIREYNFEDRITVLPGDYNSDDIGNGYDLIWASYTLNFAQKELKKVIKKVYDALNPGGIFINLSEGLTHEGTKPLTSVLCFMEWAMQNHPFTSFPQGQIADIMLEAGFRSVRSRTLSTEWGEADMDIAKNRLDKAANFLIPPTGTVTEIRYD